MTSEPAIVLQAQDIAIAYGNAPPVVNGLDITIRQGEVVGLLGESGCGKSTAAYSLLGLARPPGRITRGSVSFEGRNLLTMPAEDLRAVRGRGIGLIVQNPRSALNPMLRVGRQIANVWRSHQKGNEEAARARAIEMLRLVGINDPERRIEAYAHELSGGMAQRVLIAIALSSAPKLLVADEPTSGLDVTIQAQLLDQMWQATRTTGSSVLLVTQETGIIANYCDRVLVMHGGRIVEAVTTRRFFGAPQHAASRAILEVSAAEEEHRPTELPTAETTPLIDVEKLSRFFEIRNSPKRVQAVSEVSFTIGVGQTLGLVGESGSGKTTVGRCLLRLLEPSAGRIVYRGTPISTLAKRELRKFRAKLQIVLQDPYDSLDLRWTIERSLREPLDQHTTLSRADKRRHVERLLRLVDLPAATAAARPRNLGSGVLQRINIARALANDPEFLVLDEPTSVLAPSARIGLVRLLRRLQKELGLSFLFISHDLTTVSQVCHRVAVMYLSQVVELGNTEDIFNNPRHPYTRALIASHLAPDPHNRRVDRPRIGSLSGEIPSPIDLPSGCYLFSRCPHAVARCEAEPQDLLPDGQGRWTRCWRARAGELDLRAPEPLEATIGA
ncbi:ABC transporter ATP-binding protein [Acidisoma cellulosilytica]|uniref:ABC transporter ATP-binding protein n=1 Tax=Acidisoma cellulosilyticum TaxID=2802395 RepID=A0A963Z214_9PROT|nr:ABC transporter ATP-binding protein [Acidisoma cellulosilyticum]MCB8881407.1 ABC transporter ATP-binding protein [Acidisoma cellulosilyticum]